MTTEAKGGSDENDFRSLLKHPEANDGLDGVNIRRKTLSSADENKGVRTRLLEHLKAIEKHVANSKDNSHLGKVLRKLDKVLDVCGIRSSDAKVLHQPKSFVDMRRFMHVGGSTLVFFVDTTKTGVKKLSGPGGELLEKMLTERLGKLDATSNGSLTQILSGNKKRVRKGFHPVHRPKVWKALVFGDRKFDPATKEAEFHSLEDEIWHGHVPSFDELEHHVHVPDFGGPHKLFHSHPITERGEAAVQRLLCILQHTHPDVVYCPFLPDLCSVLVLHMPEWEVYHLVDAMIERSKTDEWFLPLSGERFMCHVESFLLLLQLRMRNLAKHIERLGVSMEEEIEVWFARMFVSFVPYDLVLRIFDCFISEGAKMLFRVGLALLKMHEKELMACNTKQSFLNRFAKRMRVNTQMEPLLAEAFSIRAFSRRMLRKLHAAHEIKEIPFAKVPVFYMPQFNRQDSKLLNVTQLRKLWKHLPALMRIQDPLLLFTTETHGYNLDILLDRTGHQSAFLVMKTSEGSIFGVFLHWRENLAKHEIGEESFVFTLAPKLSCYHYYYSDPKRWGDTEGTRINEEPDRLLSAANLQRSVSTEEDNKVPKVPPAISKSQSTQQYISMMPKRPKSRHMSEKGEKGGPNLSNSGSNTIGASSCPNSPMRLPKPAPTELLEQLELKQTKPKDLGQWRQRSMEKKFVAVAPSSPPKPRVVNSSSDQSDSDVPTAISRRRGNQLRMMHALNGKEVNLWCRRTPQWFGIGSGDRVALGIDHKLLHGVTESTTAFFNPPLNGEKYHGDFKCTAVEVWGLTH